VRVTYYFRQIAKAQITGEAEDAPGLNSSLAVDRFEETFQALMDDHVEENDVNLQASFLKIATVYFEATGSNHLAFKPSCFLSDARQVEISTLKNIVRRFDSGTCGFQTARKKT